jgi:hypothetical protein
MPGSGAGLDIATGDIAIAMAATRGIDFLNMGLLPSGKEWEWISGIDENANGVRIRLNLSMCVIGNPD